MQKYPVILKIRLLFAFAISLLFMFSYLILSNSLIVTLLLKTLLSSLICIVNPKKKTSTNSDLDFFFDLYCEPLKWRPKRKHLQTQATQTLQNVVT